MVSTGDLNFAVYVEKLKALRATIDKAAAPKALSLSVGENLLISLGVIAAIGIALAMLDRKPKARGRRG